MLMDSTYYDKVTGVKVTVWEDYRRICKEHNDFTVKMEYLDRQPFYERAKKAYAIIQTG